MALLTILSTGIYLPIWIGLSWAELRRETGDERMQPVGHALSMVVPGYNYWQIYRHFGLLAAQLAKVGAKTNLDPLSATLGAALFSLTFFHWSQDLVFTILNVIELAAATAVVVYGQRALNAYYLARPGQPVDQRVLEIDWIALALAATNFVLVVLSYASPSST